MAAFGKVERKTDGSAVYTTVDGDMVDAIAFLHYGEEGPTEAIYAANRELAENAMPLRAGLKIVLPAIATEKEQKRVVTLWD